MNELRALNARREEEVLQIKQEMLNAYQAEEKVSSADYPFIAFLEKIDGILIEHLALETREISHDFVERARFKADLAIRIPELLKKHGSKPYITEHVPDIVNLLQDNISQLPEIESVMAKGIYVNIKFTDAFLKNSLELVSELGDHFGKNDSLADRTYVVDYSSPNVAKKLHAGHLRSTIIGQALLNLYRRCGALGYGVNHINDFGGFGFMLYGYRRWESQFPEGLSNNDKLLKLYEIRRTVERIIQKGSLENLEDSERELIDRYFPDVNNFEDLKAEFLEFTRASDQAFRRLEDGKAEEVSLWKQMVEWSLKEFNSFYRELEIDIDLTIGESFYLDSGNELIENKISEEAIVKFTDEQIDLQKKQAAERLQNEEITEKDYDIFLQGLEKDKDGLLVLLDSGERLVVRRTDGQSIYATRDIGAIRERRRLFDPTDIIYVVGQEQRSHFERLFEASEKLEIHQGDQLNLKHVYFGFYIDSKTKKKLSSRDSVSNVFNFLEFCNQYFIKKYKEGGELSDEEIRETSGMLALGAISFNELRKDMKSEVEIASDDLTQTIKEFEKSGGVYVVYAVCRARRIVEKVLEQDIDQVDEEDAITELSDIEVNLISKIQQIPMVIHKSASQDNPSILSRHLVDMAALFNSYYANNRVIDNGKYYPHRLKLTSAFRQSVENCLGLLHVPCPKYI